jgi:hypothetical protein
MPEYLRNTALAADAITAQDHNTDGVMADRYARVIKVNLTGIVHQCQGIFPPIFPNPHTLPISPLPSCHILFYTLNYYHILSPLTFISPPYTGKIYRVEPSNMNKWKETTLEGSICMRGRVDLWKSFIPGESYFQSVPHGCIGILFLSLLLCSILKF